MNQTRKIPVPGEFYRHFKNKLYQIIAVAVHSETGEEMVVYQALYGDFKIWVRPLDMFLEEVDREKYPDAVQKYRFERVRLVKPQNAENSAKNATQPVQQVSAAQKLSADSDSSAAQNTTAQPPAEDQPVNRELLDFFDAMDEKNYDRMLECLTKLQPHATQKEMDDICMVLDIHPPVGCDDVGAQIMFIKRHLAMIRKFDGERLR